jgi:rhodanese-related sulfurtransferase
MVLYDHRGQQSLDAAAYFMGQGFRNVRCLRGGIDAWSREVDEKIPRYRLELSA